MKIFDLNRLEQNSVIDTDLCIIGSGPAGLSMANEFHGSNLRVLLLEGGGLEEEPSTQALYEIESTGAQRVMDQNHTRRRILGGTSHIWTGRCAPFDAIDFEQRAWVPYSGWPVAREGFEPYLARAGDYLGLGPSRYDESLWEYFEVDRPSPPLLETSLAPIFWQFSKSSDNGRSTHFGREFVAAESPNIEILLHANATHINVSPGGTHLESVDVSSLEGKRACIRAKKAVLCCGAVENARLLLASNRVMPGGIGNQNDLVGRFLMDHMFGSLGSFEPAEAMKLRSRFGHYWLDDERGRHVYLHGVGLSPSRQKEEELLNCHAYIEEFGPAEDDPWSALKRLSGSVRHRQLPMPDARLVLDRLPEIGTGLRRRRFEHRPQLPPMKKVELHYMLEQLPDPESRVTLSDEKTDALGMPISRVHWKVSDVERRTAKRMAELVAEEFKRLGLAVPQGIPAFDDESEWLRHSIEKAHPSGTTRMSANSKEGVVDANCQVHGVEGLFLAGSSVFPTSGAANPTLMIVATALRVADHIKSHSSTVAPTIGSSFSVTLRDRYENRARKERSRDMLRIGFVGAGRRISQTYLPILQQMPDQYEVTGFTAFSPASVRRFESSTGIPSFANAARLIGEAKPELLILAVPDRLNEQTLLDLLDLKIPILAETPAAWSASATQRIIEKASANGVLLGVAEQFPFLPLEQFRKQLVGTGVLGNIYAVLNDFQSYSYHAIAQLRSYLKGKPSCCRATEIGFASGANRERHTNWQTGSVTFDDGTLLVHHFAYPDTGIARSTRLYGELGSMDNDTIRLKDGESGQGGEFQAVRRESEPGRLASISAGLGKNGTVVWENPFAAHSFSDEQIAVASIMRGMARAVREGIAPLYTAADFLKDIEIVQAFRYSAARNGAEIPLPFSEWKQKTLQLTNVGYWKRKLLHK